MFSFFIPPFFFDITRGRGSPGKFIFVIFEMGRQRAQAEMNEQYYEEPVTPTPPPKRRTWLWVLGWIFIFPLPLTVLLIRKEDMKPVVKYAIIAAVWVLYFQLARSNR